MNRRKKLCATSYAAGSPRWELLLLEKLGRWRFIPVEQGGEYGGEFDVKHQDPYHYNTWDEER